MMTMQSTGLSKKLLSSWGPAVLMMVLIFLFSSLPSAVIPTFGKFDFSVKKLGHMLGYALLAPAYLRGLGKKGKGEIAAAWFMAIMYSITDETHQAFIPGRNSSIFDIGIDGIGALAGLSPMILLTLRTLNRNPHLPPKI